MLMSTIGRNIRNNTQWKIWCEPTMGDRRRNKIFAKFIRTQFPKAQSILVVADGNGELSCLLANLGYEVVMFEPKPRNLKKSQRVKRVKAYFTAETPISQDLVVGMHPDESTIEIIMGAKQNEKPFAVVPCCIKVLEGRESYVKGFPHNRKGWVTRLRSLYGMGMTETYDLKMRGANTVVYARR